METNGLKFPSLLGSQLPSNIVSNSAWKRESKAYLMINCNLKTEYMTWSNNLQYQAGEKTNIKSRSLCPIEVYKTEFKMNFLTCLEGWKTIGALGVLGKEIVVKEE